MFNLQHKSLLKNQCYINGKWISASSGKTFEVFNPYDNKKIADVVDADVEECKTAIEAAGQAFKVWKNYSAGKRSRILKKWYQLQIKHQQDLAKILTIERFVEWFAEEARRIYGDVIPGHGVDKRITVIKQPVGVVGAITPWNFPNAMITRKVAPALAAGCTVVIKPSELTPLSALALAALAEEAGFPPGVLNIITTNNASAIGLELCNNPIVKKISFTGSTQVGKLLLQQSAASVKKVSLELGGNAPFIVFNDADIDKAVEGAIASKFRNAGQTCICSNRLFVQSKVYDAFVERLATQVGNLNSGNGLESNCDIGPLISNKAMDKVQLIVDDAIENGASLLCGGKTNETTATIYKPTILTHATQKMKVFTEEIFGPVAPMKVVLAVKALNMVLMLSFILKVCIGVMLVNIPNFRISYLIIQTTLTF